MSEQSVDHLERAKAFIERGEDYYRRAGEEIIAAREAGWSWPAISEELAFLWCGDVFEGWLDGRTALLEAAKKADAASLPMEFHRDLLFSVDHCRELESALAEYAERVR